MIGESDVVKLDCRCLRIGDCSATFLHGRRNGKHFVDSGRRCGRFCEGHKQVGKHNERVEYLRHIVDKRNYFALREIAVIHVLSAKVQQHDDCDVKH